MSGEGVLGVRVALTCLRVERAGGRMAELARLLDRTASQDVRDGRHGFPRGGHHPALTQGEGGWIQGESEPLDAEAEDLLTNRPARLTDRAAGAVRPPRP